MYDQVLYKKNEKGHFWRKIRVFTFFQLLENFLVAHKNVRFCSPCCTFLFTSKTGFCSLRTNVFGTRTAATWLGGHLVPRKSNLHKPYLVNRLNIS